MTVYPQDMLITVRISFKTWSILLWLGRQASACEIARSLQCNSRNLFKERRISRLEYGLEIRPSTRVQPSFVHEELDGGQQQDIVDDRAKGHHPRQSEARRGAGAE